MRWYRLIPPLGTPNVSLLPKNTYTKAKKLADEKAYDLQLNSGDDAEDVNVWDFVSLADYVSIVTNGKNWSSFFEEMLDRRKQGLQEAKKLRHNGFLD